MKTQPVNGLQKLFGAWDDAEHQYWFKHGVKLSSDNSQTTHEHNAASPSQSQTHNATTRSLISAIHHRSNSITHPQTNTSKQQGSPHTYPLNSAVLHSPNQPSASAKMGKQPKTDLKWLSKSAQATSPAFKDLGQRSDGSWPKNQTSAAQNRAEKMSKKRMISGKRRRRASSGSPQTLDDKDLSPFAKRSFAMTPGLDYRPSRKITTTDRGVSFVDFSVGSSLDSGSDHRLTPKTPTEKSKHFGDSRLRGDDPAYQVPLVITKSHRLEDPETDEHGTPQQPQSELHRRKVKESLSYSKIQTPAAVTTTTTPRSAPRRPSKKNKRIRLSLDPWTPDPVPSSPPIPDPEESYADEESDEESDEDYTVVRRKRTQKPNLRKPTATATTTTTTTATNKRSLSAQNRNPTHPLVSTLSSAPAPDKMIFRLKAQGKPWREINQQWTNMTGKKPGASSLSVRYMKLKEKFRKMESADLARLLTFKHALETSFEATEKWNRLAIMIASDGGATYTGEALKRKFRDFEEEAGDDDAVESTTAAGAEVVAGIGEGGVDVDVEDDGRELDDLDRELLGLDRDGEGEDEDEDEAEEMMDQELLGKED